MSVSADSRTERPRDRRRRARVESILDASMALFYEEGIEALTMRRLADSLDLTPGALYRYFPGKDAILLGLGNRALQQVSQAMEQAEQMSGQTHDLSENGEVLWPIVSRCLAYWRLCVDEPPVWRLLNLFLSEPKQMITETAANADFMNRVFAQIGRLSTVLEQASERGVLDRSQTSLARALALLSALNGSLLLLKMAERAPVPVRVTRILWIHLEGLLVSWGAEPDDLQTLRIATEADDHLE